MTNEDATTKPTNEIILDRINALGNNLEAFRGEMRDFREYVEIRLDRIESEAKAARSEVLTMRADFREFRGQFKQPA